MFNAIADHMPDIQRAGKGPATALRLAERGQGVSGELPKRALMRTRAAALLEQPGKWQIVDVELDEPAAKRGAGPLVAAGLCHSDDHASTGDMPIGKLR